LKNIIYSLQAHCPLIFYNDNNASPQKLGLITASIEGEKQHY